ncbi:Xaa-Pro aminopeptidase PepP [Cupriavidus necator N-1]|uniref:Xaa-Pro aminopeptidase n=1 Tax=Cupriavidus necator (strain ATCC 43291 / DSM 13513 / CCUG 52238 / LMG 8453 / N-1) TaxID=1042878 RepID=G0EW01_CUPNN|nr:aminopeptidase P N-terminal domain-containing protein [Cupriavidus necator]AEI75893.1 Xaa-Pro aminopeptidase PepP [Cupriavidus necator N-1]KAI3599918.1 Xaa-Pro aminopeptidase [Cupriavidus necator H850]MDX6011968.1 aminopeptidase P N-terminal domain-containing protein [Cupriavidus necator]
MSSPDNALLAACRDRRARVLQHLRAGGGGVAILPTAPEAMRNRDSDYPYRHDSYFYYLSGFTEPDAVLVLVAGAPGDPADADRSILFCRPKHEEREIWDGFRFGPEGARAAFGFDEAHSVEEINAALPPLLANRAQIAYPLADSTRTDVQMRRWLDAVRMQGRAGVAAPSVALDIRTVLDEMRLFKDAGELATMRRAAQISAGAHVRAMQATRAGLREYHLEAELLYEFRRHGAQSVAYNSIVAAGPNACVLHYRAGPAELRDGDLCLIDAGCEFDGYASDITRTFPVSGRFSPAQRELYDLVVAAQDAAIAETRAGVPYNVPHDAAVRVLAQGMLDTGLLDRNKEGTLDDVLASGSYRRFYMHRTGHWLGMDVHDVGEYRVASHGGEGERPWRPLQPGMVLTIEPGIYVRPAEDVPERYWHIGIRIEDDAVVTDGDCELITRGVPVLADEIEALMRDNANAAGGLR